MMKRIIGILLIMMLTTQSNTERTFSDLENFSCRPVCIYDENGKILNDSSKEL